MSDKTLLIVALGVGAFLMTRQAGAQPVGNGATAAQKAFAAGNRGPAVVPSLYGQAGSLLGGLLGKLANGSGESLTSNEFTRIFTSPDTRADVQAVLGNGNVFDMAAAGLGKNPFGIGLNDALATNPAPGFSSVYDYSKEYWF